MDRANNWGVKYGMMSKKSIKVDPKAIWNMPNDWLVNLPPF